MTLSRIKSPPWGVNEKLTSAQMNAVDANIENALDKRAGQTDSLASSVTVASGGSIVFALGSTLVSHSDPNTRTSSATTTLDFDASNNEEVTLDQNTTIVFGGAKDGGLYVVVLKQNGTGGWTVTWPVSAVFGSLTVQPSATANKRTIYLFYQHTLSLMCIARNAET